MIQGLNLKEKSKSVMSDQTLIMKHLYMPLKTRRHV
jgi:hypothetical protein